MAYMQTNALRRANLSRAKIWYIVKSSSVEVTLKLVHLWRDPRQSYPQLTDRQAHDLGIDPADLEWRRIKWPSQNTRHPML